MSKLAPPLLNPQTGGIPVKRAPIDSWLSMHVVVGVALILLISSTIANYFVSRAVQRTTMETLISSTTIIARNIGLHLNSDLTKPHQPNHRRSRSQFDIELYDMSTARDAFARSAAEQLRQDPTRVIHRVLNGENGRLLRLIISVPSATGHSRAMLEIRRDVDRDLAAVDKMLSRLMWFRNLFSLVIVAALAWLSFQTRKRQKDQRRLFDHVTTMAYTDSMTGLLNRGRFMELGHRLAAGNGRYFVLVIDVDHFKEINDEFGHGAGDAVIFEVGRRLSGLVDGAHLVARLGGDEFIMAGRLHMPNSNPVALGRSVVETLAQPLPYGNHNLSFSASVGCAISETGEDLDSVILKADEALYHAKQQGRNRCELFSAELQQCRLERRRIEKVLRQALANRSFELHYQPVVDGVSGEIRSFEALLRLKDGEGNLISPSLFIPMAEDQKLICAIGEQVLHEAMRFAATWPEHVSVNINLSPRQFAPQENNGSPLLAILEQALRETGISPRRVVLEVTENVLLSESPDIMSQLEAIRALGFRTALDDFGSGYSSLSYLWKFKFDSLKIDQSFAKAFSSHSCNLGEIVRSITTLAQSLQLDVVAEGVETEEAAEFFCQNGCNALQGYLISRPLPATDVAAFILRNAERAHDAPLLAFAG
ncbi:putative bifunctional diguanylate cyclase/phosphodiesterase [Rhizobium alvei]|uniref:EAL domain-containing protein n=1 Tax=Rhizobium alvei TaxID=1132659 RepID=A0ABT8YGQ3_9HYPH|nr:GGDEF domain-containing phosphodiesterase [Rhizobium alvei]MDO6962837.1 EAL domain-containing protein [Rhizobium alvei]